MDIHQAAKTGDVGRIQQLLAEEGNPNERDQHARTPIHLAAWAGHLDVVEELVKAEGIQVSANARDDTAADWRKDWTRTTTAFIVSLTLSL